MGSCKAELPWGGKTLVEHQVNKISALGGIHACLCAAKSAACFVISVDATLVSPDEIKMLMETHLAGGSLITVAEHCGTLEPFIGVYDSSLSDAAEGILQGTNTSVKCLLDKIGFAVCEFSDENSVRDCNTPDEYAELCADTIGCTGTK